MMMNLIQTVSCELGPPDRRSGAADAAASHCHLDKSRDQIHKEGFSLKKVMDNPNRRSGAAGAAAAVADVERDHGRVPADRGRGRWGRG